MRELRVVQQAQGTDRLLPETLSDLPDRIFLFPGLERIGAFFKEAELSVLLMEAEPGYSDTDRTVGYLEIMSGQKQFQSIVI